VLLALALVSFGPAVARGPEPPGTLPSAPAEFKPGEVLVKFGPATTDSARQDARARHGATRIGSVYGLDIEVWQVPEGQELAIARQLRSEPGVEYAQPNYVYHALGTPNDPYLTLQWAHGIIRSEAAWDITTGSSGIKIAIIDTGIDETHPDLASRIVAGWDFVDNDNNPHDLHGHGTHVAGIAAAVTNNGVGVAGMDWKARIMPVRVLDDQGTGYSSNVASGIGWACDNGAKVINVSLGTTADDWVLQNAVANAHTAGSLVVAAMGNCRTYDPPACPVANPITYPAGYSNDVMAVAATTIADAYAPYSQFGSHCDIAAPGGTLVSYHDPDGIFSTMPTYSVTLTRPPDYYYYEDYDYLQGTSMATPYVAGLAALVWSLDPALTPDQVQTIIENTAVDLDHNGWDPNYGYGRIDAQAALLAALNPPAAPTLSPISNPDGDGTYLVDWNDVPTAASYTLQEDNNGAFTSPEGIYTGPDSQFNVTGRGGGTWYYRVRASNAAGDSPWSNTQAVVVKPVAPVLNSIDNPGYGDAYLVSWQMPVGAAGYRLEEADNPSFAGATTRYDGSELHYAIAGQSGGTWYYRVLAYNSAGDSPWSNTRNTTVGPRPLPAPTMSPISNPDAAGDYLVDWSDVTGATSYTLEQSSDPYFAHPVEVYTDIVSRFDVIGQPGGTWYYRARASGADGSGSWSNAQSTVVTSYLYLPLVLKSYDQNVLINEGFESGAVPPPGWTLVQTDPDPSYTWKVWPFTPPYPSPPGPPAYDGLYSAACDADEVAQNEVLLSPPFQASSAQLQFHSFGDVSWCYDSPPYDCQLNVWLVVGEWDGVDPVDPDVLVYTANPDWLDDFVWSPSAIDLTPPAGVPVRLGFQYIADGWGDVIGLDAIRLTRQ
jgi:subtilisin family serine protease